MICKYYELTPYASYDCLECEEIESKRDEGMVLAHARSLGLCACGKCQQCEGRGKC